MPHQYLNHVINQSTKRRMHDDNEEEDQVIPMTRPIQAKRQNDLSQEFNPNNGPPKAEIPLPSLTFASPDYRPPPRADALWLQPVPPTQPPPSSQPMMEEDSTDEDDILPANTNAYLDPKQPNGIDWIMTDQC